MTTEQMQQLDEQMQQLKEKFQPQLQEALSNLKAVFTDSRIPTEAIRIEFILDLNKLGLEEQQASVLVDGLQVPLSTENQQLLLARCECVPCNHPDGLCCWKCT